MASYNELNALIDAYINRNGVQAITGQILNGVLKAMVEQLGRGYTIMGAATPTTDPGTPDGPECYFASETGTYTDFDGLQVAPGELALLCYTPTDGWTKATIYEGFQEVGATIDENVGTPSVGVSYANGVLSFDFHNMKGNPGQNGQDGAAAGFGTIGADITGGVGTPGVSVESSGPATAKNLQFHFTNLKGETGVTSVVATVDNTTGTPACTVSLVGQQLTLAFSGLKGAQGNTGSSVDYPFTIVNNLTTDDATQALSAAQGVVLAGQVSQLEHKVGDLDDAVMEQVSVTNQYDYANIGGYYGDTGTFNSSTGRGVVIIPVVPGASYTLSTYLSSTAIYGALYTSDQSVTAGQNITTIIGKQYPGSGSGQALVNQPLTIPVGTTFIIAQTANRATSLAAGDKVSETTTGLAPKVYTKSETDALLNDKADAEDVYTKTEIDNMVSSAKYGVKWSTTDDTDLGTRVFGAVGLTATIGVGATDGSSDFDSIYPWSEIKRCNIKSNANGAKIVTFEGETGFAIDGSNGDVFVRIPKFCVEKYIENGFEYRVISANDGNVHPAFIENGKVLDEIFIGAFEASGDKTGLFSKAGVIPTNNIVPQDFLDGAQERGANYSLYDMRCVDALWTLMAVEYGCRNSNRILGYGIADYYQPVFSGRGVCIESANNTNSIKTGYWTDAYKAFMPIGSNITICRNQDQKDIVTQAKLLSVADAGDNSYTVFTFDGDPVNVDTDCFIGSAPCDTGFADTCATPLHWHTGRALFVSGGQKEITRNPVRYRWIENPVGNLWHFLPDVTFNDLQMYVCDNMADYVMHKYTSPYRPVGPVLPAQADNGNKGDVNTVANPNYWMTSLLDDIFAKGNCFGKSFDTVHDGTLLSTTGFGGYYYLKTGTNIIANGGGFDHLWRCNVLTHRAWTLATSKWYLCGARLMYKNIS